MKLKHIKQLIKTNFPVLLNLTRKFRSLYYPLLIEKQRKNLRSKIKSYYKTTSDNEILEILSFLETNRVEMIPYALQIRGELPVIFLKLRRVIFFN